jgi:cellulose synthase/poly-beta-1,6-N-acetylglucosamine synthase-like glycosyltransferase
MMTIFYIFAALLVYFSFKSFLGGVKYLTYFKKELAKPHPGPTPFLTIIAPCKGVDEGMEANLDAVLQQDYPAYEVVFVVNDENDPAGKVIESAWREAEGLPVKLVVAEKATESGQKVENLRTGVLHADERSEIFVFVDSDARPGEGWLRALVAAVENRDVGAATGYRWFLSDRPTLATELRAAWNASIASAFGPDVKNNFCWGGSTAIRREVFERLDIRQRWLGTLSDDFTLTRALKDAGLSIRFVPQALTPSFDQCGWRELFAFTTRQMKITRVYSPYLWQKSLLGSGLFVTVVTASFAILSLSDRNGAAVWAAVAVLALVSIFSAAKSWLRLKAVRLALPQFEKDLKRQRLTQLTLWLASPYLFFVNCVLAGVSRTIEWRGIRYTMASPRETRVEHR